MCFMETNIVDFLLHQSICHFFTAYGTYIDHATATFSYINRSTSADLGGNVAKHLHHTRSNGHLRLDEHREFLTLASYTHWIHVWYTVYANIKGVY